MAKSKKLPALQFYGGDWRKDPGIQSLDYHDKGVWFEILLIMHESEERGKLVLNTKPMTDVVLARILGLPLVDILDKQNTNQIIERGLTTTLTTLLEHGVATREEDTNILICRRMVRDEELRKIRTKVGKLGGNPNLLNQNNNQKTKTKDKQNPTPSSSISTSDLTTLPDGHSQIDVHWQPSAEGLALCKMSGLHDKLVERQIPVFAAHHAAEQTVHDNWPGKFVSWCKRALAQGWDENTEKGESNGKNNTETRSRSRRVSDELDEIARQDIEQNGLTEILD